MARRHSRRSTRSSRRPVAAESDGAPHPDPRRAFSLVMELMAVPGKSREEGRIVETIVGKLKRAGVPASAITIDGAARQAPGDGEVGNLIVKLPGTARGPRRLLVGHVDTVPLCVGSRPIERNGWVASADKRTGVGADNRAGASVMLNAALEIVRQQLQHPPLTFLWPVQEEIGLWGARYVSHAHLGRPRLAFNWDGGSAEKLTVGATGAYRLHIEISGLASHAGGAPEKGISAIAIAGLAIAELQTGGWHGHVRKGHRLGTSNVGFIQAGGPTNVVTDHARLEAEARSHDPVFRRRIVREIESAFRRAAKAVKNRDGKCGRVAINSVLEYESFKLPDDEPCVLAAEAAVRGVGRQPLRAIANGGLDANWLTARGIPTVSMGCGQQNAHMLTERLNVAEFQAACRIALRLATARGC